MVSFEELGLIISVLTGTVVPIAFLFLIRHVKAGDSTSNKAVMATFNIDTIKDDLRELKQHLQELKQKQHEDNRKLWERVDQMHTDVKLHDYRLNKLDRNGTMTGAVII